MTSDSPCLSNSYDPFAGLPRVEYAPDPIRERVLLALANSDIGRWPAIDDTSSRHAAELMYGHQADAVIELWQELTTEGEL